MRVVTSAGCGLVGRAGPPGPGLHESSADVVKARRGCLFQAHRKVTARRLPEAQDTGAASVAAARCSYTLNRWRLSPSSARSAALTRLARRKDVTIGPLVNRDGVLEDDDERPDQLVLGPSASPHGEGCLRGGRESKPTTG